MKVIAVNGQSPQTGMKPTSSIKNQLERICHWGDFETVWFPGSGSNWEHYRFFCSTEDWVNGLWVSGATSVRIQ
jgi:hypothetical protein